MRGSSKFKWVVDVNDGFCTWRYTLVGNGGCCINDVVTSIESGTNLKLQSCYMLRRAKRVVVAKPAHNTAKPKPSVGKARGRSRASAVA